MRLTEHELLHDSCRGDDLATQHHQARVAAVSGIAFAKNLQSAAFSPSVTTTFEDMEFHGKLAKFFCTRFRVKLLFN